uniref:F-box and WD repeat domain containing 5 n=1 Tax=Bos indicus x Bos taurus TaxID=30522 RepID=A0A4W2DVH9_BOBOX
MPSRAVGGAGGAPTGLARLRSAPGSCASPWTWGPVSSLVPPAAKGLCVCFRAAGAECHDGRGGNTPASRQPGLPDLPEPGPGRRAGRRAGVPPVAGCVQGRVPVEGAVLPLLPSGPRCAPAPRSALALTLAGDGGLGLGAGPEGGQGGPRLPGPGLEARSPSMTPPPPTAATSWFEEFRRLYDAVPCVEVQTLREHTDQVLHLSFSHSGYQFASCSKDCTVKIWNNDPTISLLHSADMRPYNWSYTQFSQFNQDDSLLLASGVFLGPHNSSSGEIAVISLDTFALLSRVRNKPYDVFGCWLTDTSLISGNLHRIGDITSCSVLWLNNAFQDVESENVNVVKRLFKIQNLNASTIRTVMVADCSRFDSPDLLLDAGAPGTDSSRVFDLGSDGEDEESDPGPARAKGLRRLLDGFLEGRAQPPLPESTLETKVAKLLAQGHTKPPEQGRAAAGNKLLIFTTGCLTYSPHQIGIKQILPHQMTTAGPVLGEGRGSDAFFDALDHVIDVHGHIIGMGLSPDNRYLYVNSRAWPSGSVVADPMQPPPIAEEIDLLVFDLKTMREVKRALRAHRAYTPNDECFFIFLDVSRDFVASGAEDRHGYIWDRHYNICLAKLRHEDVVNSVVFSPQEQELLLTASDDATIKAWRSPRTVRVLQAPRPRPRPFFSWFASQKH